MVDEDINGVVKAAVARSMPSPTIPRAKTETEARLAPTEAKTAECYADMETTTARLRALAIELAPQDAVPLPNPEDFEDISTVHHIQNLVEAARPPESDDGK